MPVLQGKCRDFRDRPAGLSSEVYMTAEVWNIKQPASTRESSLLRLRTNDGREGWGEAKVLTRESLASLRAHLKDAEASAYEALRVKLKGHAGAAAVNAACLDIMAKTAKAPLYQFLGGPTRNKVRAFTALHGTTDDDLLKSLDRSRSAGLPKRGDVRAKRQSVPPRVNRRSTKQD